VLTACARGGFIDIDIYNNSDSELTISANGKEQVVVQHGSKALNKVYFHRYGLTDIHTPALDLVVRRNGQTLDYRIPRGIPDSYIQAWPQRGVKLQIDESMTLSLLRPGDEGLVTVLPEQPRCYPLLPFSEVMHSDVRKHTGEPSPRSKAMYSDIGPLVFDGGDYTWIKVPVKDVDTGAIHTMFTWNTAFASFVARTQQVAPEDLRAFVEAHYIPFMEAHENRPIEFRLCAYTHWWFEYRGLALADEDFEPYTLAELGFDDRLDVIAAFFDVDPVTGTGGLRPPDERPSDLDPLNPRLMALLIDLGALVVESPRFWGGFFSVKLVE
jgi:hypothetical protein